MKVPGRAWLILEIDESSSPPQLVQTAIFEQIIFGVISIGIFFTIHCFLFQKMARKIAE